MSKSPAVVSASQGTQNVEAARAAFVDRLLRSVSGFFDIYAVYIGDKLGFYRALADSAPRTSGEIARKTNTYERHVREWLEQQTVAGILHVDRPDADAKARRYSLSPAHREVLVDRDSLDYLTPVVQLLVGAATPLEKLLNSYRTGEGVAYADYGKDMLDGQAGVNRAMFLQLLGKEWIPAMKDVDARLRKDPPAKVADFGCGAGWSCIGIAQAYPKVEVDGLDLDAASVKLAKQNVREAGLSERVDIQLRDAADPALQDRYDLVCAFECIHDLSNPVAALRVMWDLVKEGGSVLIVDERVGETFMDKAGDVDWMMYGWSILHCLAAGLADKPSAETGTVMRPDTLRRYATEAGFSRVEVLPVQNAFFRLYRLYR